MGTVSLNILKAIGKLAVSFTVASLGTFAGNCLYDTFMTIKEEKEKERSKKD